MNYVTDKKTKALLQDRKVVVVPWTSVVLLSLLLFRESSVAGGCGLLWSRTGGKLCSQTEPEALLNLG